MGEFISQTTSLSRQEGMLDGDDGWLPGTQAHVFFFTAIPLTDIEGVPLEDHACSRVLFSAHCALNNRFGGPGKEKLQNSRQFRHGFSLIELIPSSFDG